MSHPCHLCHTGSGACQADVMPGPGGVARLFASQREPSVMQRATRLKRHVLTAALLSSLALPAYAGVNCQIVDASGNVLTLDSSAPGAEALACGPDAKAN